MLLVSKYFIRQKKTMNYQIRPINVMCLISTRYSWSKLFHTINIWQNIFFNAIPTGIKEKLAILFSMLLIILSRPLLRNIPELVRTLQLSVYKLIQHLKLRRQQGYSRSYQIFIKPNPVTRQLSQNFEQSQKSLHTLIIHLFHETKEMEHRKCKPAIFTSTCLAIYHS